MISFADTGWEVFSLAGVFLLGLALMPSLSRWLGVPARHGLTLYAWHSIFCVVYILYSMSNPADSIRYFTSSLIWDQAPALGTRFVIFFNSLLSQGLGMSYGGSFFAYNILGSVGLIAVSAALREAFAGKSRLVRQIVAFLPFLPGFSFWSTAIGKDSIAFFGVGLICWAAAQPYRRFPAIVIGFVALLVVRPHMAGFLTIALALAYSLANGGPIKLKLVVSALVLPTAAAVTVISLDYLGLDEADSLIEYVEQRQSYNTEGGSSVDIANASIPTRLFMYVFRPLFIDASGAFGLVVSFENLVLFGIGTAALYGMLKRRSSLTKFQRVFFSIYVMISWLALANTTANLGIAIRQKTMFTPMLMILLLSYLPNFRQVSRLRFPRTASHPQESSSKRFPDQRAGTPVADGYQVKLGNDLTKTSPAEASGTSP